MPKFPSAADAGARIAAWRKSLDWSQQRLAGVLGVSRSYLGDVEAGRSEPSGAMLTAITSKTAASADWILTGRGSMCRENEVADAPAVYATDTARSVASRVDELAQGLERLDPETQAAILSEIRYRIALARRLDDLASAIDALGKQAE